MIPSRRLLEGSCFEASRLQLECLGVKLTRVLPRQTHVLIGNPFVHLKLASIGWVAVIVNWQLVLRTCPIALTSCRATNCLLKAGVLRSSALLRLAMTSCRLGPATVPSCKVR